VKEQGGIAGQEAEAFHAGYDKIPPRDDRGLRIGVQREGQGEKKYDGKEAFGEPASIQKTFGREEDKNIKLRSQKGVSCKRRGGVKNGRGMKYRKNPDSFMNIEKLMQRFRRGTNRVLRFSWGGKSLSLRGGGGCGQKKPNRHKPPVGMEKKGRETPGRERERGVLKKK